MPQKDPSSSNPLRLIAIYLAAVALLSLIVSLFLGAQFWGLDSVKVFPTWVAVPLVVLAVILAVPGYARDTGRSLEGIEKRLSGNSGRCFSFGLMGIMAVLFVALSSKNHLLGDGYNVLGLIKEGTVFAPTEPLGYFIHHVLSDLIPFNNSQYLAYAITSFLAGIAFMAALYVFLGPGIGFLEGLAIAGTFGVM